ncbi:MAG: putative signal transducing protein [Aureliella sp.]
MSEETKLVRLTEVQHEAEAGVLVAALETEGIQANSTGDLTSGFRAESPGAIAIWVHAKDLEEAQRVVAEIEQGEDEVDWSEVDTGDATPVGEDE